MSESTLRRSVPVLIGIGLVLAGLLAGILGMLLFDEEPPSPSPVAKSVERVELGRTSADSEREIAAPDPSEAVSPTTLNQLFKKVADRVTPAVVFIQVEVPASKDLPREWFHNFDEDSRRRFFREHPPRQSVGSGVIVSDEGHVVTNQHVVDGAETILVTLSDKRVFEGRVVGADALTDLAVVALEEPNDLPVIELGNSDRVQVGEWVLAVGNPFRLTSTVTAGIVSALGRQVDIIEGSFRVEDFIQTDAAINPGNSGGALVNLQGELVGIATAIATESGSYEGYGFAVPSNLMERVVTDLIAHGEVQRGYLGVSIEPVTAQSARRLGLDSIGGVLVQNVTRGGAADRGGIEDGDVVLAIDDAPVNDTNELQVAVLRRRPGDEVAVDVWRDGERRRLQVELMGRDSDAFQDWVADLEAGQQPMPMPETAPEEQDADVTTLEEWGLGVRDVTQRERDAFEVADGAYVAFVEHGSRAHVAGVPRDVVVQEVDGQAVDGPVDLQRMLDRAAEDDANVLLQVRRRDGVSGFYEVVVPE